MNARSKHLARLEAMSEELEARGRVARSEGGTLYRRVVRYARKTGQLKGVRVTLQRQGRGRGSSLPD